MDTASQNVVADLASYAWTCNAQDLVDVDLQRLRRDAHQIEAVPATFSTYDVLGSPAAQTEALGHPLPGACGFRYNSLSWPRPLISNNPET